MGWWDGDGWGRADFNTEANAAAHPLSIFGFWRTMGWTGLLSLLYLYQGQLCSILLLQGQPRTIRDRQSGRRTAVPDGLAGALPKVAPRSAARAAHHTAGRHTALR